MRTFLDEQGTEWVATIQKTDSVNYQGRFHLAMAPNQGSGEAVSLHDVRWNSEHTARRTLETMSAVELRRRLRSARGRVETAGGA